MEVIVAGLGPGPIEWVSDAVRATLADPAATVFLRTTVHPAVGLLGGRSVESFDRLYQDASDLDSVYRGIADRLQRAAAAGARIVYAVPGDGTVAEAAVALLRQAGLAVRVVPGISIGATALAAAGVEASAGVQEVEASALVQPILGGRIEPNPGWPLAATGIFSTALASEVKLALQPVYPAEHPVVVVFHAGLPEQVVRSGPLARFDRDGGPFDPLTHLVVPPVSVVDVPTGSADRLRALVARLRTPEIGCPWDLAQDHRSLTAHVVEEAYEVVEAIEHGTPAELADELGDLLLQVVLHAEIADQAGAFNWNDVVRGLSEKLIRRHPHVFGDTRADGPSDAQESWDTLKSAERDGTERSALDGVPRSLPALKLAAETAKRAVAAGFDWPSRDGALAKVHEELAELLAATSPAEQREELGDLLWILAHVGWREGIDPEEALRAANHKFVSRFRAMENIAAERGWAGLAGRSEANLLDAWTEAKQRTAPDQPP